MSKTLPLTLNCLFCNIVAGNLPVKRIYEDDMVLAFPDISPQAPVHILLIPKQHLPSHAHTTVGDTKLLGYLLATAREVAQAQGLAKGYRLVINTGSDGGQTVEHLHVHLLGGRHLGWPPG